MLFFDSFSTTREKLGLHDEKGVIASIIKFHESGRSSGGYLINVYVTNTESET